MRRELWMKISLDIALAESHGNIGGRKKLGWLKTQFLGSEIGAMILAAATSIGLSRTFPLRCAAFTYNRQIIYWRRHCAFPDREHFRWLHIFSRDQCWRAVMQGSPASKDMSVSVSVCAIGFQRADKRRENQSTNCPPSYPSQHPVSGNMHHLFGLDMTEKVTINEILNQTHMFVRTWVLIGVVVWVWVIRFEKIEMTEEQSISSLPLSQLLRSQHLERKYKWHIWPKYIRKKWR